MISIVFDWNHFFEMHNFIISETLNEIDMFKSDVQSKVAHEIFEEN